MNYIEQLLESKAGSQVRFEMERGDTPIRFVQRVKFARNTVKKKGIITTEKREANNKAVTVKVLSDLSWPASAEDLAALESKREPTLTEWARKRKRPPTEPEVGTPGMPLIERLPPQDAGRAAARGARVANSHAAVGHVPSGNVSHLSLAHSAEPQHVAEPVSFDQTHEEQMLWREVFVTSLRTNPMGKDEDRVAASRAAVEAFRDFFG